MTMKRISRPCRNTDIFYRTVIGDFSDIFNIDTRRRYVNN